jgi:hypothetical protein
MAAQEKTLTCGQIEWFYRMVEGNAASNRVPVVLLHGLPATGYSWRGVMLALAERGFWAIAPDWIGFGASSKPDRRSFAYTPDAYVTALETFLANRTYAVAMNFLDFGRFLAGCAREKSPNCVGPSQARGRSLLSSRTGFYRLCGVAICSTPSRPD